MTRNILIAALTLALIPASTEAAFPLERTAFDVKPVSSALLAETHGTYDDFDVNFKVLLSERSRADERVFSSVSGLAMDNWWANVGSVLIAANINR